MGVSVSSATNQWGRRHAAGDEADADREPDSDETVCGRRGDGVREGMDIAQEEAGG